MAGAQGESMDETRFAELCPAVDLSILRQHGLEVVQAAYELITTFPDLWQDIDTDTMIDQATGWLVADQAARALATIVPGRFSSWRDLMACVVPSIIHNQTEQILADPAHPFHDLVRRGGDGDTIEIKVSPQDKGVQVEWVSLGEIPPAGVDAVEYARQARADAWGGSRKN